MLIIRVGGIFEHWELDDYERKLVVAPLLFLQSLIRDVRRVYNSCQAYGRQTRPDNRGSLLLYKDKLLTPWCQKSCWTEWVYAVYRAQANSYRQGSRWLSPSSLLGLFAEARRIFYPTHAQISDNLCCILYLLLDVLPSIRFHTRRCSFLFQRCFQGSVCLPMRRLMCRPEITADKSYCYAKVFGKLSCKEEADCTPCP